MLEKLQRKNERKTTSSIIYWIWLTIALFWTPLKWMISINVFFHAIRAVYYWENPEIHAGWTFLIHFTALTALTYFVSTYKPKDIEF